MKRRGARAPARLVILFVLVVGIPLGVLGWAAWRIVDEDRARGADELRTRLSNAAQAAAAELDRGLASWEERLPAAVAGEARAIPSGASVLVFDAQGVVARHGAALLYHPRVAAPRVASDAVFSDIERTKEYQGHLEEAATLYRQMARSDDPHVRAGALLRLARSLGSRQRFGEALTAYEQLAAMGSTPVGISGDPSELAARKARLLLFEKTGNGEAKQREAALLGAALSDGRFLIDRATFEAYSTDLPLALPSKLHEAVEDLWPQWQRQPAGRAGRQGEATVVAVWRPVQDGTAAMVGSLDLLMASASASFRDPDLRVALEDSAARAIWGAFFTDGTEARRSLRENGLPWTLRVTADAAAMAGDSVARRNLMAAGFGLMALVIAAASYFVFRALTREFRVARLQSEFVAAVSHEFRTPLAAMRHLTDLLEEGDVPPDRLASFYRGLGKETRRLHAMVESLLDFAKLESGRRVYDMRDSDASELAGAVVGEFREQHPSAASRIEWFQPAAEPRIRADREALALAIRNLLDNAVKYSPESSTVSVSVDSRDGCAHIAVTDRGMGLANQERRDIFRRFVRGRAAKALNVKGTGIGLTMAQEIVNAHGGRIAVASEPGQGSQFTIVLPLAPDALAAPASAPAGTWSAS
jgi:two-component system phosphate regulon sensor histidine kinase PhoR